MPDRRLTRSMGRKLRRDGEALHFSRGPGCLAGHRKERPPVEELGVTGPRLVRLDVDLDASGLARHGSSGQEQPHSESLVQSGEGGRLERQVDDEDETAALLDDAETVDLLLAALRPRQLADEARKARIREPGWKGLAGQSSLGEHLALLHEGVAKPLEILLAGGEAGLGQPPVGNIGRQIHESRTGRGLHEPEAAIHLGHEDVGGHEAREEDAGYQEEHGKEDDRHECNEEVRDEELGPDAPEQDAKSVADDAHPVPDSIAPEHQRLENDEERGSRNAESPEHQQGQGRKEDPPSPCPDEGGESAPPLLRRLGERGVEGERPEDIGTEDYPREEGTEPMAGRLHHGKGRRESDEPTLSTRQNPTVTMGLIRARCANRHFLHHAEAHDPLAGHRAEEAEGDRRCGPP